MILKNEISVPVPVESALAMLIDVPKIAPCLPGVTLTKDNGDGSYEGTASVRLGPVALSFSGKARIENINHETRSADVIAEGADKKGRGSASANVQFQIEPDGENSLVKVETDLNLTGSIAQYGRASGLIEIVAKQIIADFTKNLEAELSGDGVSEGQSNSISGVSLLGRAIASGVSEKLGFKK